MSKEEREGRREGLSWVGLGRCGPLSDGPRQLETLGHTGNEPLSINLLAKVGLQS